MSEFLLFIRDILRIDILVGFGFYSISYFIIKDFFKDKKWLADFDKSAIETVIYIGIIWFVLWLFGTISNYFELETELQKEEYCNEQIGKYAYAFWVQPLFWFILTQLFRLKFVTKYLITRIIISLLFVITIERFIILITSFHRDYLPSDWSFGYNFTLNPYWILIGWMANILIFIVLTLIYHFGIKKIKNAFQQRI
ncbi:hypothetical protein [Kordia zhangzhouensis]|uniref:hypothetical protein n=1 Tax=Kordia zhangzhouensis TaxID=1620405 RepID=UPI0006292153|nr:hypothetical protein [Kordia zhangzhouensis]